MNITTEQVKELRDKTGISVMQCKKALEEAGGDMEKALMILKKKSGDIAAKKSDRVATDGLVVIKKNGNKAIAVVLNCETDFVSKNEDFVNLANAIADKAVAEGAPAAKSAAADMISPVVQKIGENIQLAEVSEIEGTNLGAYIHGGKKGVIVALSGGDEALAKDIAMHVAAMNPKYTTMDDVPEEDRKMAVEIFSKEVEESGKPEEIKQKILKGKIDSYFKEQTLLEQPFIKNPDMTIGNLLKTGGAEIKIEKILTYSLK